MPEAAGALAAGAGMSLTLEDVSVTLAQARVIRDVSLRVERGCFVGIIGPNGSGKTTLLKSVYKALRPDSGAILLEAMDLLRASPRLVARHLGVVGQFNEVGFDFSVHEMVMMGRQPHKHLMETDNREDYRAVEEALRATNLEHLARRSFLTLSGGEKQRVILARALAQNPRLLVLDEPTNHLDIKYQLQILGIIKGLGISVLAALHDLQLAIEYCDHLYAMKAGALVAHGEPRRLLTRELVAELYEVRCEVYENPVTGRPAIAYLGPSEGAASKAAVDAPQGDPLA
jgi:iron complex transport system ATP-binding protein